jgi:hypothetical protein
VCANGLLKELNKCQKSHSAPDASGTGIFTIASPNSNTNCTLTLPDNAGTIITSGTAGTVLQVVSTTKTDTFSTASSSSLVDVTGCQLYQLRQLLHHQKL